MTDWKKEAESVQREWNVSNKVHNAYESLCWKAWNEAIEKAAGIAEGVRGKARDSEDRGDAGDESDEIRWSILALKHKEPDKQI